MKRFQIVFDGENMTAEALEGCTGPECVKDTEKLVEVLKPTLKKRNLKSDYYRVKVGQKATS